MDLRIDQETTADGTRVIKRYEDGVLVSRFELQTLPSGKRIDRNFDANGDLVKESHGYGMLQIQLEWSYTHGKKTSEMYFVRRRLVSRKSYEKAREAFADMPASSAEFVDIGGELRRDMAVERRERARKAARHEPNAKAAKSNDRFCEERMHAGTHADAIQWIESPKHTLGERDRRASVRLVKSLVALGCKQVVACEIDEYPDGRANTGHLVVELPVDPARRAKAFKTLDRLAEEQGFSGDMDHGQRYAYLKLD